MEENGLPVGPGADEGPRNTSILLSVASDCCASTLKFAALLVDQQEFDFNFRMYAKSPSGTERELATIPTPTLGEVSTVWVEASDLTCLIRKTWKVLFPFAICNIHSMTITPFCTAFRLMHLFVSCVKDKFG